MINHIVSDPNLLNYSIHQTLEMYKKKNNVTVEKLWSSQGEGGRRHLVLGGGGGGGGDGGAGGSGSESRHFTLYKHTNTQSPIL